MGLELAEQLGWDGAGRDLLSDRRRHRADRHVEGFRRTGGDRLHRKKAPAHGRGAGGRLRADGQSFEAGEEHAPRWENAHTIASGIRVPQAIGDFLILRAVRESGGFAIAVEDDAITAALDEMAREEGFLQCPEGAATYAAYKQSLADGRVEQKRSGGAVQLRERAEISVAQDRAQARPAQADRLRGAIDRLPASRRADCLSKRRNRGRRRLPLRRRFRASSW